MKPSKDLQRAINNNERAKDAFDRNEPMLKKIGNVNLYEKMSEEELVKLLNLYKGNLEEHATRKTVKVAGEEIGIMTCVIDGIDYAPIWQRRILEINEEIKKRHPETFKQEPIEKE